MYSIGNGVVTITGYTGNETDLVIPNKIEVYPVTTIDNSAFYECSSLRSVELSMG